MLNRVPMRSDLQTIDHFSGKNLRLPNLSWLISASTNAYADVTGTFKNIENSGSGTDHPKSFISDARYFLWRPRPLAFLFSSVAVFPRFFVSMKSVSPELPGIARAGPVSSLGDSQADGVGKRRQCTK